MKSIFIHYKNKYPKGHIDFSGDRLDAFNEEGEHCVALRKNGAGMVYDASAEFGCKDRHDLSPIPKMSRLYKADAQGLLMKVEEYESRVKAMPEFMDGSRVMSCEELMAKGYEFDSKQLVTKAPTKG